jgi:hypothetical protein
MNTMDENTYNLFFGHSVLWPSSPPKNNFMTSCRTSQGGRLWNNNRYLGPTRLLRARNSLNCRIKALEFDVAQENVGAIKRPCLYNYFVLLTGNKRQSAHFSGDVKMYRVQVTSRFLMSVKYTESPFTLETYYKII